MDIMEIRRRIIDGYAYTIGGFPVLVDNAYFPHRNGLVTDYVESPDFFITGWFDSGSTSVKTYRTMRIADIETNEPSLRLFNNIAKQSVDYWTVTKDEQQEEIYDLKTIGRYIAVSVYKPRMDEFFMQMSPSGLYLFRGAHADL